MPAEHFSNSSEPWLTLFDVMKYCNVVELPDIQRDLVLPQVAATVIARHAGPVRLAGGLTVHARHGFDTVPPRDVVMVRGGGPGVAQRPADLGRSDLPPSAREP